MHSEAQHHFLTASWSPSAGVASTSVVEPNIHGCHCFRLCTPTDVQQLRSRLPRPASSVWSTYLRTVYNERPSTPLPSALANNLARLEVFYPSLLPTQPCWHADKQLPRCERSICAEWLDETEPREARATNSTFALSTDGLSPWRRAEFVLSQDASRERRAAAASTWVPTCACVHVHAYACTYTYSGGVCVGLRI